MSSHRVVLVVLLVAVPLLAILLLMVPLLAVRPSLEHIRTARSQRTGDRKDSVTGTSPWRGVQFNSVSRIDG